MGYHDMNEHFNESLGGFGGQAEISSKVVATQIFVIFTPEIGEMIQFDEHFFQLGWFNHQLVMNEVKK